MLLCDCAYFDLEIGEFLLKTSIHVRLALSDGDWGIDLLYINFEPFDYICTQTHSYTFILRTYLFCSAFFFWRSIILLFLSSILNRIGFFMLILH